MIDIKYMKSKYFKDLSKHDIGQREKIQDRLIDLLDQFIDVCDPTIKVVRGCDVINGPDTVHGRGEAVHIVLNVNIIEAFIKALSFRANVSHGPNFFTGVGCYVGTWELEKDMLYSGLHLDIRPVWFNPIHRHIDKLYPEWTNPSGVHAWGCLPNPKKFSFIRAYYKSWDRYPLINNKIYVPIDKEFIELVNICGHKCRVYRT